MSEGWLLPKSVRANIQADLDRPPALERLLEAQGMRWEERHGDPIEGEVVDESEAVENFCRDVVESMSEWDWSEVPAELRNSLRQWATAFRTWTRSQA